MSRPELRTQLADEVPGLLRYARTIVRDEAAAEDLVQETFVRALEKLDTFRGDASLATWLHRILHNRAVDLARRRREDPVEDVAALVEDRWRDDAYTVDATVVALRAETREDLQDALLRLPFSYRTAVLLHDMEELTVSEIAKVQDVGLPAAKQRLRRGRMMLVTALAEGADRRAVMAGVPMRCWDARSLVADYLDDVLEERERALIERHLASCPTCPPLYGALVASTAAVTELRDRDSVIPAALADRLRGCRHDAHEPTDPATPAT